MYLAAAYIFPLSSDILVTAPCAISYSVLHCMMMVLVRRSQRFITPSLEDVINSSLDNTMAVTLDSWLSTASLLPVNGFHIFTVLSSDPLKMLIPLKAKHVMGSEKDVNLT